MDYFQRNHKIKYINYNWLAIREQILNIMIVSKILNILYLLINWIDWQILIFQKLYKKTVKNTKKYAFWYY